MILQMTKRQFLKIYEESRNETCNMMITQELADSMWVKMRKRVQLDRKSAECRLMIENKKGDL